VPFAAQFFVADLSDNTFLLSIDNDGLLFSTTIPGIQQFHANPIILADDNSIGWQVIVQPDGTLRTINVGPVEGLTLPSTNPPTNSALTPIYGYVIAFRYQMERQRITDASQMLQVPYQYFDVVLAGVNYYASLYTAKAEDLSVKVAVWKKEFLDGLKQIRRDLRINFRNTDVILPDSATQYQIRGQSWYYGLG
jgi:hypothetical protein